MKPEVTDSGGDTVIEEKPQQDMARCRCVQGPKYSDTGMVSERREDSAPTSAGSSLLVALTHLSAADKVRDVHDFTSGSLAL